MKQNQTSRRLAESAQQKLATILLFEISDPRLEFVTVTDCEVSVDRSLCRAYVSCEPDRYDEVLKALEGAKGKIRSLLGSSLGWRVTPELIFAIDRSADEAARISRALQDVPPSMLRADKAADKLDLVDDDVLDELDKN